MYWSIYEIMHIKNRIILYANIYIYMLCIFTINCCRSIIYTCTVWCVLIDGSGEIDLEEFRIALFAVDPTNGNTIGFNPNMLLTPADAFEMFDDDGSGEIGEDEFADVLEYLGIAVSSAHGEKPVTYNVPLL